MKEVEVQKMMLSKVESGEGKKFDNGKNRVDLLPPYAIDQVAKVLSFGSIKYGDRNWEQGIKWSKIIGSLKRHLSALEQRIDIDNESGLLHASHIATNALMLLEYHKIYPQGDDRVIHNPKIGLDIDDVLADFIKYYCNTFNLPIPITWNFDRLMPQRLKDLSEDFWLNIPCKTPATELPFEPYCYITARSVPKEITQAWLDKNNYPQVPLYSVGFGQSKVEVAKDSGIDIFVDDYYKNYVELNNAGICTYLFTADHNMKYDVGYKRINNLNQILNA